MCRSWQLQAELLVLGVTFSVLWAHAQRCLHRVVAGIGKARPRRAILLARSLVIAAMNRERVERSVRCLGL